MNGDRRKFLKQVGSTAAAVVAASTVVNKTTEAASENGEEAASKGLQAAFAIPQTRLALELNGVLAGWIQSFEGGMATAEVILEKPVGGQIIKKHLGPPQYEDITITFGPGMTKEFYDWIKASFNGHPVPMDGAIIAD